MDESIALGLDMSCVALTEQEDAAAAAADVNFLRDAKETMNKNGGIVVGGDITVNDLSEPEEERPPEEEAERAAATAHLLDTDFPETEDLLDAAGIFECVNLPAFEELQELPVPHGAAAASSATASASSSSASVSSPSTSWMQKQEEGACFTERHSSCAPSADQDPNLSSDSATSSSLANSIKTEPPTTENCLGYDSTEKIDLLEELENLEFLGSSWDIPDSSCLDGLQDVPDQTTAEEIAMPKENASATSDELPKVFFEWLKSNRDSISPEDLRRIKLKKSTIEQAAKHLGGGTKGMLTLLKLILAWVQIHHLERKRKLRESGFCYNISPFLIDGLSNNSTSSASVPLQVPYDANLYDPSLFPMDGLHAAKYRRNAGPRYLGDASAINGGAAFDNILQRSAGLGLGLGLGIPSSDATNAVSSSPSWQMLHPQPGLCNAPNLVSSSAASLIPSVQPHLGSEFLSAGYRSGTPAASTKEARKNRMARQRRSLAHHHHHHRQWAAANSSLNPQHCSDALNFSLMQQLPQRQNAFMQSDRRQGWKPEKNLKFLLQKVLKQSDVGGLGRIVLPKKEAEAELPKLEARDGITITMEDITTSRVWSMRYRFWPNNKSRMYLLENTGDFVRSNNLQEGDFIVIFLDTKTGKYMIRGVKVPRSDTNTNTTTTAVATATAANSSNSNTSNSSRSACGSSKLTDGHASKVANISPSYASSTPHPSPVTTHPFSDSFSSSKPSSSVSAATATATATDSSSFPQPKIPSSASPKPDPTLERVPSIESGDLTIEEIMDLVDSPDENHDADADADQDPNRDA